MVHVLVLLFALLFGGAAQAQCIGALATDGSNPCPDAATFRSTLGITGTSPGGSSGQLQINNAGAFGGMTAMSGGATLDTSTGVLTIVSVPAAALPAAAKARGFTQPFSTIPTTGDPDVYQMPTGASAAIAASTVPDAICRVSPAATVTFLVKKWSTGNPATSSTLCTGSLSTSCAVSGCSISATTIAATDGISIEATAASADTAARVTITVPWTFQ